LLRCLNKRIAGLLIALTLGARSVYACGFYMPNRVLFEDYALKVPKGYFADEVKRIEPSFKPGFQAMVPTLRRRYSEQTETGDIADLTAALSESDLSNQERDRVLACYKSTRELITNYVREKVQWQWNEQMSRLRSGSPGPYFTLPKVPDGLLAEFDDYIRGAIAYHSGDPNKAVETWRRLLDRPAERRKYKSTWAAFMIGKALLESDPGEAVKWFGRVRDFAQAGFADSIGLAASSLGWEARAELNRANDARAIELYVAQMATGDPTVLLSLVVVCRSAVRTEPEELQAIARNSSARMVLTAYIVSRLDSWPYQSESNAKAIRQWLDAVETANVDFVKEADRLAWAAYQLGDVELTDRWLRVAAEDAPMTHWLRAKLLLRAGKVDEAGEQLRLAARNFAPAINEEEPRHGSFYYRAGMFMTVEPVAASMRGELGVLYLARRQYAEALDVLLAGGHWHDAAYVAERVLTPQELKEYVDRAWPAAAVRDVQAGSGEPGSIHTKIRYLLARRLGRLGKWADARAYYPVKWRERFDIYTGLLRDGSDQDITKAKRAAAFWKASVIARHEGIELLGTEVEPDWFILQGNFSPRSLSEIRSEHESENQIIRSTSDETRRTRQHVAVPNLRYHYRYTATQHAWRAAKLMPDNSEETARVLCIAGSWLKAKDPNEADRFYKALVLRCRKTKLGQEADKLRWFPKIEMSAKKLLEETP